MHNREKTLTLHMKAQREKQDDLTRNQTEPETINDMRGSRE